MSLGNLEDIEDEYLGTDRLDTVRKMSDEELINTINNEEWQLDYRALCKKEYINRQNNKRKN